MNTLTQPLRDEHKELYPNVERIREVAELAGTLEANRGVEEIYNFLAYHLKPHAQAEEAALYPAVQRALGSREATATMARDHVEVGRYIEELAALRDAPSGERTEDLRRVLYGVYALLKVHFAKEEEVYLPILEEALTPESVQEMFEAMEAAAHEARAADQF